MNKKIVSFRLILVLVGLSVLLYGCTNYFQKYEENSVQNDESYFNKAVETGNGDLCGRMVKGFAVKGDDYVDFIDADDCYKTVAKKTIDPSLCGKIGNQAIQNDCYRDLAPLTKDLSLCDAIKKTKSRKVEVMQDYCYNSVAIEKADATGCEKIQDQQLRTSCFIQVAVRKMDHLPCDKLEEEDLNRGECYAQVAIEKNDSSVCDILVQERDKGNCYFKYAIKKHDPSICEKIQNEQSKNGCYSSIASNS